MSSRVFLNAAHALLVEELQRPKIMSGTTVPGLALEDALKIAEQWAEGFVPTAETFDADDEDRPVAARQRSAYHRDNRELTEEEMVAKNNAALAWLERRMANVGGGGLRGFEAGA